MAELIAVVLLGAGVVITLMIVWHRESQRQAWWHHEMMTDARNAVSYTHLTLPTKRIV